MDLHLIIVYLFATFFSINGLPFSNSVFDQIKRTASDVNFKCPYVRTTKLLEPEPKFLENCNIVEVQAFTTLIGNVEKGLCLLYYDTFEHLCYVSNSFETIIKELLSNDQIEKVPVTYQRNVTQVCTVLKNTKPFLNASSSGIELLRTYLENGPKCEHLCTDLETNVKPICSLTAFMMNITTKLYQEIKNQNVVDLRNDKVKSNKPSVIDHNAVNQAISKKLGDANQKQAEVGNTGILSDAKAPVEKTEPGMLGEGANPTAQQNFSVQNVTSKIGEAPEEKGAYNSFHENLLGMPAKEQHNLSGEQPPTVPILKPQSTSSEGLIKKLEEPSNSQEEEKVPLPATVALPQNIGKSIKDQHQIKAPSVSEKLEGVQVSSSPSTNTGNNNAAQIPGGLLQEQRNGNQEELPNQTKIGTNMNSKKPEEDGGNVQVVHNEPPKMEDTNGDIEVQIDAKLSTKGEAEGAVEAAGEAPQDAKNEFLDETDGDSETDFGNNAEDYNIDEQPKPSEVKINPEKSKPREIDEDGPSFAASNYQNQSIDDSDSYFFSYFMMVCIMFICGYVAYHNKQKILALVVEGRKGRRTSRTRRPNSANYRKLDSNLEEAVTSSCNKNATQVIY